MKLYHGTNVEFDRILLSKCRPNKDFGRGFYLTDIRSLYMQRLISLETLVRELTYRRLNNQYFFGSEKSINLLQRV